MITAPRAEWAYNKSVQHIQDEEGANTADGNNVKNLVLKTDRCTPLHPPLATITGVGIATSRTNIATKKMTPRYHHGTNISNIRKPISPEH